MLNIPTKTLILIGVLITVAVFLLALAVSLSGGKRAVTVTNLSAPTPTSVEKTATVSFSPTILDLSKVGSTSAAVNVMAAAGKTPVTGVQVEILYDPTVITSVKMLPPDLTNSLFGEATNYITLFTDTKTPGKFMTAVAINLSGTPVSGMGSIGKLSFTVVKSMPQTQISFGKKTIVTARTTQESILNFTTPLTIKLQ